MNCYQPGQICVEAGAHYRAGVIVGKDMEIISEGTDVLKILPEAAADLCTALFRNSPAGIYITRDGKFIYTNIEFRHITGYSQDELSGKDYQRLINPRYRHMSKQNLASLFEEEEPDTSHEFKITTREGKKKWISEKITYFKYGGNWLTLGHWLDISEYHSVKNAWREAERRFQLTFEDIAMGLSIIGTDGIFLKVNKSFCDMLGFDERELLESHFDEVLCQEDRHACGDLMTLFLSLEKPEMPLQIRMRCKDGHSIWASMNISLIGDSEAGPSYFIVNFQDITEQKRREEGYKEEERLYRSLVDLSLEPVAVLDLDYYFTHVSLSFAKLLGYESGQDLLGKKIGSIVKEEASQQIESQILAYLTRGEPGNIEQEIIRRDGTALPVAMHVAWINRDNGALLCIVISITTTTGQNIAEKRVEVGAEVTAPIMEKAAESITNMDAQTSEKADEARADVASPAPEKATETTGDITTPTPEEAAQATVNVSATMPEEAAEAVADVTAAVSEETVVITPSNLQPDSARAEEHPLRTVLESTSTALLLLDQNTVILSCNAAFEMLSGFTRGEIEGKKSWMDFVDREDQRRLKRYYLLRRLDPPSAPGTFEFKFAARDGSTRDVLINISPVPASRNLAATLLDLAEYKQAIAGGQDSGQISAITETGAVGIAPDSYRHILEALPFAIVITDLDLTITLVSGNAFDRTGELVIGLVPGKNLRRFIRPGLLEDLNEAVAGLKEAGFMPYREFDLLQYDGHIMSCEISGSLVKEGDGPSGMVFVIRDILYLKQKYDEQATEQAGRTIAQLDRTLEGAITAIVRIVEMRDPNLTGHQDRVARLAAAIARELNLPEDAVRGIETAARLHDIGKVYVPIEILSKPGALTTVECQIVQSHAQGSYDILKSIDFPWPVAEIAYQHHERLDGSGYPRGLKGDQIIPEAMILIVADVVDEMTSNRPYRPGCGIDAALDEISSKGGILYDQDIVEACVRLFREGRFSLDDNDRI